MARKQRHSNIRPRGNRAGLFFWHLLERDTRWRLTGALVLFCVAVFLAYHFIIEPSTRRWLGYFGDSRIPQGFTIRGIDVSHHQGPIDWEKLARANIGDERIAFAFIKATEGTTLTDKQFGDNFCGAHRAGFVCGAYHYFRPEVSAIAQARHFVRTVPLTAGDLPPVLDVEEKGDLSDDALSDSVLAWLRYMEGIYKTRPILYTYAKFRTQYLRSKAFDAYPYWIAHYYVDSLTYQGAWKFWQHTDRGRLPGISGDVDLNCYNGSMYDLRRLLIAE